ncbi:iron chelate uptake ABC transporter family permease subunit [Gordonia pseudamarae]|uniref:Iron chelate uptake ABC transporter family permease subunit n=2 Tax=Gordoniaceae TaxID=85026 RepID=A0ABX6IQU0_9ACTN|nr:iron chelate uptake ABC transporter family permease subunit [Gordonia pseudamarae]QHN37505.1 iron chelate uptake ABC transporter family permease subunit [Gordonia pseudamarae]
MRIDIRGVLVVAVLIAAAFAAAVAELGTGELHLPFGTVVQAVFGGATEFDRTIVNQWRAPRVVLAVVLGALLGISGAIFQSLTRNPLGSPDIIGFNTGAYTGALVVLLLLDGMSTSYYPTAVGALVGGILTALLVYLLAFKRGVQGFRLIIVGIAISAVLSAVNTWLILKADLQEAMSAAVWGAGTLNNKEWAHAQPVLIVAVVMVIPVFWVAYRMPMLDMGDDSAAALGIRVERTRLAMIVVGVSLTAIATAAAGPISFVALAAPQLAKRLTRSAGVTITASAAMGAVLLVVSDWIAQFAFGDKNLPVGVVTVSIGGLYLVWLLAMEARRQ